MVLISVSSGLGTAYPLEKARLQRRLQPEISAKRRGGKFGVLSAVVCSGPVVRVGLFVGWFPTHPVISMVEAFLD